MGARIIKFLVLFTKAIEEFLSWDEEKKERDLSKQKMREAHAKSDDVSDLAMEDDASLKPEREQPESYGKY